MMTDDYASNVSTEKLCFQNKVFYYIAKLLLYTLNVFMV